MMETGKQEVIYRHSGAVRFTHWVNVIALLVLLMSGLQIFNAHPALYLGSKSTFDDPVMAMRPMKHGEQIYGVTTIGGWQFDTTGVFGSRNSIRSRNRVSSSRASAILGKCPGTEIGSCTTRAPRSRTLSTAR